MQIPDYEDAFQNAALALLTTALGMWEEQLYNSCFTWISLSLP